MGARGEHTEVARLRTEVEQLQEALASRDVIGQAKGMMMERHGIGPDEAFQRLVRISQATNTKLHAVAARVVGGEHGDGDGGGDGQGPEAPEGMAPEGVAPEGMARGEPTGVD